MKSITRSYNDTSIEFMYSQGEPWFSTSVMALILDTTERNIYKHIKRLEDKFQEGRHFIMMPTPRMEGGRSVTRNIRYLSELGAARVAFRVDTDKADAFQDWAAEVVVTLKRDGVVYNDDDATKRLELLLDELGVPKFVMGGLLGRVVYLAGLATRKRKMTSTALSTTTSEAPQNVIALAHAHLDEVGTPHFAQPNEAERLAARLTYLAAVAGKKAKALLIAPEPNYQYIAGEALRILRTALNEGRATLLDARVQGTSTRIVVKGAPVIGFFCNGYKNKGIALNPNEAYKLIIRDLAHEGKHTPHPYSIWRALMKTGHLARVGMDKGRNPWLVRLRHPSTQNFHRVVLVRSDSIS